MNPFRASLCGKVVMICDDEAIIMDIPQAEQTREAVAAIYAAAPNLSATWTPLLDSLDAAIRQAKERAQ